MFPVVFSLYYELVVTEKFNIYSLALYHLFFERKIYNLYFGAPGKEHLNNLSKDICTEFKCSKATAENVHFNSMVF